MTSYRRLLVVAAVLALFVVSLGAYVRLSNAGLGCPDWPGCYGHIVGVPTAAHEQAAALRAFPHAPVETDKAWKEMVHRYCAGGLGLLIAAIAAITWRRRPANAVIVVSSALVAVVALQATLGMWTVTLLLKPVIVSLHLVGGMTTLALIVWLTLAHAPSAPLPSSPKLRAIAATALAVVAAQIALGGWVSSNYAALACPDFPTCLGSWLPEMDFAQAFQMHRELGQNADGAPLSLLALAAIHWSHRMGALIVATSVGILCFALARRPAWRGWALLLAASLIVQLALGVANVVMHLPLAIAVAHNTGAAILLVVTIAVNFRLWSSRPRESAAETGLLPTQAR
jgi:cytochrome c oxidase assembly protein subunit 15